MIVVSISIGISFTKGVENSSSFNKISLNIWPFAFKYYAIFSFLVEAFKNVTIDADSPYFDKSSSLSFGFIYLPKFLFKISNDSLIHFSPNLV